MKKIILALILTLGSISTAQADFWKNGIYYYTCTAYSSYSSSLNGNGYSSFSRVEACAIAMSLCQSATPVGYSCSF